MLLCAKKNSKNNITFNQFFIISTNYFYLFIVPTLEVLCKRNCSLEKKNTHIDENFFERNV